MIVQRQEKCIRPSTPYRNIVLAKIILLQLLQLRKEREGGERLNINRERLLNLQQRCQMFHFHPVRYNYKREIIRQKLLYRIFFRVYGLWQNSKIFRFQAHALSLDKVILHQKVLIRQQL